LDRAADRFHPVENAVYRAGVRWQERTADARQNRLLRWERWDERLFGDRCCDCPYAHCDCPTFHTQLPNPVWPRMEPVRAGCYPQAPPLWMQGPARIPTTYDEDLGAPDKREVELEEPASVPIPE